MKDVIGTVKSWVSDLTGIGISFIGLGVVLEAVFGSGIGFSVLGNLTGMIDQLFSGGLTSFVTVILLVSIFDK